MTLRHSFIFDEQVGSTNARAAELLQTQKLPEGTVVYTNAQTAGVGLGENKWLSEPGKNITASVVLYPDFLPAEEQFKLTMVISVSVCNMLESLDSIFKPQIKWPNDIYLNHRKVAGMLIKNNISGNTIAQTIAGLGLNVNQTKFDSRAPLAVSLAMISGKGYKIFDLLTKWHTALDHTYHLLKSGKEDGLEQAYLERFYRLNQWANFTIHGESLRARITGIGEYGMLQLTGEDERKFSCGLKEVVFER
jgi:BirA family biotin operon repressor/biotin-[acetyl-CoA-carboxylase] ligase